jgi:nucleoside-diphosphate-sugar epimerase
MKKIILIFGNGYVAQFLSKAMLGKGWIVYCTSRKADISDVSKFNEINIINFFDKSVREIIKVADVILSTVPQDDNFIDPVLSEYGDVILQEKIQWIGYLSSTGVYGNHYGRWVNEDTKCIPTSARSKIRLLAEEKWLSMYLKNKSPIHIFRLSGIYGPKRNCLEDIINGKDFVVVKKDQYFSRIHVEDICQAIMMSIGSPTPGEIYNVSDDEPTPSHIVHQFGAKIIQHPKLREVLIEEAVLSDQAKSFFQDNKMVSNNKILQKLGVNWKYPNYRVGLLYGCLPYLKNRSNV